MGGGRIFTEGAPPAAPLNRPCNGLLNPPRPPLGSRKLTAAVAVAVVFRSCYCSCCCSSCCRCCYCRCKYFLLVCRCRVHRSTADVPVLPDLYLQHPVRPHTHVPCILDRPSKLSDFLHPHVAARRRTHDPGGVYLLLRTRTDHSLHH